MVLQQSVGDFGVHAASLPWEIGEESRGPGKKEDLRGLGLKNSSGIPGLGVIGFGRALPREPNMA